MEPVVSLLLAFLAGALVILLIGENPISTFKILLTGAFGSAVNISNTLLKTTTLTLTGLSYAFAYRCGLVNIGAEGQMYVGALCATLVVMFMPGPGVLVVILALIAGFLGGAIFGLLAGFLKVRFGANEVITTVMLNYVAMYLVQWAVCGPIQDPNSKAAQTAMFDTKYWLATLPNSTLHVGVVLVVLSLVFFGIFLWKTAPGFGMQIVGQNKNAAAYAGIDVKNNTLMAMFMAGGFAGLAGAIEVLGVQHRLLKGMASNYGFDGMAVALLGGCSPVGMLLSGVLLGAMKSGGNTIQMFSGVPSSVVDLVRALVIVFVLVNVLARVVFAARRRKEKKGGVLSNV
jgi:simple sugar transport system permease protein